jgi:hypothetical protein
MSSLPSMEVDRSTSFHHVTTSPRNTGELTAFDRGQPPTRLWAAARTLRDRRNSSAWRSGRWIHHRTSSLSSVAVHQAWIGCNTGAAYYASPKPNPNLLVDAVVGGPRDFSDAFPDACVTLRLQATAMTLGDGDDSKA